VLMIGGTTVGLEIGKELLNHLQEMGLGDLVLGIVYVFLLGGIGLFVTRNALKDADGGGIDHDADQDVEDAEIPEIAQAIQSYHVPPMVSLKGGYTISLWMILLVGFATGLLSGFLGVGGGFIRMPALFYLLGVPVPIAVGTDLFEIVFSGGIGSFLYALDGSINLSIVMPLLAGSALGARIGSASTSLVDEEDIKIYFGLMLVGGSISVAAQQLGKAYGIEILNTVSIVIIFGAAILVAGAVVVSAVEALREEAVEERASPAD
jgi:uncharacterized membrane protein YfcA